MIADKTNRSPKNAGHRALPDWPDTHKAAALLGRRRCSRKGALGALSSFPPEPTVCLAACCRWRARPCTVWPQATGPTIAAVAGHLSYMGLLGRPYDQEVSRIPCDQHRLIGSVLAGRVAVEPPVVKDEEPRSGEPLYELGIRSGGNRVNSRESRSAHGPSLPISASSEA